MNPTLADISTGNTDWAELLFAIAFVLFLVAAWAAYVVGQVRWSPPALAMGLAAVAAALFIL